MAINLNGSMTMLGVTHVYSKAPQLLSDRPVFQEKFTETSTMAYPFCIMHDGTHFWVGDLVDSKVYQYDNSLVATGVSYPVARPPHDLAWDGTYYWLLNGSDNKLYRYDESWQHDGFVIGILSDGIAVTWDGEYLVVSNGGNSNTFNTYDTSTKSRVGIHSPNAGGSSPSGITFSGMRYWSVIAHDTLYSYDSAFTRLEAEILLEPIMTFPQNLCYHDGSLYLFDRTTREVFRYA